MIICFARRFAAGEALGHASHELGDEAAPRSM